MNILDKYQQEAFKKIKANCDKNFLIQGQAGTGKSTLINHLRGNLGRTVAVVAPTGIAAQLIGGSTIHRMFHLGAHDYFPENVVEQYQGFERVVPLLDTLIIDEASMLRADVLDTVNVLCQKAKKNDKVFGGIQVVLVGDLYQLPPVYKNTALNYMLQTYYVSRPFFFDAKCYAQGKFEKLELRQVHRQDADKAFLEDLQAISVGNTQDNQERVRKAIDSFHERVAPESVSGDIPIVTARRDQAETINHDRLAALDGAERVYRGTLSGDYSERDALAPVELHLKVGAKVMFCRNDTSEHKYVNGTNGTIVAMGDDEISVRSEQNEVVNVCRATWEKQEYVPSAQMPGALELHSCGSFCQFPLKLAYAITIHKSQGQTWNHVCIDMGEGGAFAEGQAYVALSRVKTKTGVHLARPLSLSDVKSNPRIHSFLETGVRPRPMAQIRDIESVKKFWRDVFPEVSSADSVCHCANSHHIYRLNGQPRFWGACYWFSCPYTELERTLFLICMDNRKHSSVLFKIPAHAFGENVFDLDMHIRSNDGRHQNREYKDAYFDLFLETEGHYMELRKEVSFAPYMIASETNWEVRSIKENSEDE